MELSQLIMHKPNTNFHNNQQSTQSLTMFSLPAQQQSQLSPQSAMLPDDHWNDIEIISFGLNDTHLSHHDNVISANANNSIVHYAASNNYLDLLKKLITTDKSEIDLVDQVSYLFVFIQYFLTFCFK